MTDEQQKIEETKVEQPKVEEKAEQPKQPKVKPTPVPKITYVVLHSKANFNVPITYNGQIITIPPFGRIKIVKERMQFDPQFARYLTLIKA